MCLCVSVFLNTVIYFQVILKVWMYSIFFSKPNIKLVLLSLPSKKNEVWETGSFNTYFLNSTLVFYSVCTDSKRSISHSVIVKLLPFQAGMPIKSLTYLWGTIWTGNDPFHTLKRTLFSWPFSPVWVKGTRQVVVGELWLN